MFVICPSDFTKYTQVGLDEWLEGTVVSIMNYGAFVRLEGDVDGMVHISQLDAHGERVDSVYNAVEVCVCAFYVFLCVCNNQRSQGDRENTPISLPHACSPCLPHKYPEIRNTPFCFTYRTPEDLLVWLYVVCRSKYNDAFTRVLVC